MAEVTQDLMQFRSKQKVRMVREEVRPNGTINLIDAYLPIGRGWNQGQGVIDWINLGIGWRSYDEYMATKHAEEVAAKRDSEKKKVKADV